MQEDLLNSGADEHLVEGISLSPFATVGMLVFNVVPLLLIVGAMFLSGYGFEATWARVAGFFGTLYLFPPLLARFALLIGPTLPPRIEFGSRAFFAWWFIFQLQVVFCRLPFLEESLRLIPGLYSAWLRLWGSKVGRCVYWAPGTRVLDRSFLDIGNFVVLGAGVRLNAHVLHNGRNEARSGAAGPELLLAKITIGEKTLVGGYSLLTSGSNIPPLSSTPPCHLFAPFSCWSRSKRRGRMILPLGDAAL